MGRTARVFVVSGPAGVGKGTLVALLRNRRPDLGMPVSATTRSPRLGEQNGVAYHFLSDEEFSRRIAQGAFLEWAQVHDHRYGTLKNEVDECLLRGESVVLEIDVQGGANVAKVYPDAVRVFIEPPSWEVLEQRLRGRGTESPESLALRLKNARKEMALADTYDVRIVNDDLNAAAEELVSTVAAYESQEV